MTKKLFLFIGIVLFTNIIFANTPPTIFNFRIEASESDRVYFDSDKPIIASNFNGFTISNKSITGITINEGQLSNHYFKISSSFSYWDNNTIRYEGGSDVKDTGGKALLEFTLSYIVNNIPEPDANEDRYVNTSASGGGDGKSEGSAWTLDEAFDNANAGMTVWIKAGNYGNQNLALYNDGTSLSPLKFIGYKNSPGDINDNYYDYGKTWSTSEMPTLTGASASDGHAIQLRGANYVVFRNLQIKNYQFGIRGNNSHNSNIIFDRINGHTFGKDLNTGNDRNASFMVFTTYSSGTGDRPFVSNNNMKVLDCRIVNAAMVGYALMGEGNNLIDGSKSYNDRTGKYDMQDYHIGVNGHNNIIRNCYIENFNNKEATTPAHGIGVRGSSNLDNTYNLIEKSTAINMQEGFYLRNYGTNYNVIKDVYAGNNGNNSYEDRGGIWIMGGCNNNVIERAIIEDVDWGFAFSDVQEEGNTNDTSIGFNNIIRNCVIRDSKYSIYANGSTNSLFKDNKILNCTFEDSQFFYKGYDINMVNLEFINCNITNVITSINTYGDSKTLAGINFKNSSFWNSWGVPSGIGNTNTNPQYVSPTDLHLSSASPITITEGGQILTKVQYDLEEKYRGSKNSIGAYQYGENTTGSVNAGEDVIICPGNNTVLTAIGTGEFLWNTGETTASITVSPDESTTYTVTLTDGDNTDSDEVIVTVMEPPVVTLADDINSCLGSEITLTAEGNGDFLWSTGETGPSINVNPLETTTYIVTSSIECGSESLSVSDSIVVNINSELVLTAGLDVSSCPGTEIILLAEGTGDFLWNTGETTASITVSPTETTTYTVTSSNADCTVSDDVIVTIIEEPEVTLGDDLTICYGSEVALTANGNGNFLWSTGETTASINVTPLETTEYILIASVNCGSEVLSVSDTIVVNVTPELTLNVSDDVAFCSNQETTLTANSNGNLLWSTGETTASITVNPTETTTYTVTSALGDCTLTDEVTVTISEQPTVDLGNDLSICSGNDVTLTAQGNGAFLWSTGSTKKKIEVSPTETTSYIVTSSINCGTEVLSVSDTITVNVIPNVTLSVSDDQTICAGTEVTLTANSNASYLWNNGETTASITVSPSETITYNVTAGTGDCAITEEISVTVNEAPEVNLGEDKTICSGEEIILTAEGVGDFLWSTGETSATITVNPSVTTVYSITSSTNCGGSTQTVTDNITINVTPTVILSAGEDLTTCLGTEVILTATGNSTFLWSTGETTASITVNPSETTIYSVSSGSGSCAKTDKVTVNVDPLPTVNLGDDVNICYGEEVVLFAEGNGEFLWSTGETTDRIRVSPLENKTYMVTASGACGSSVTDEIIVNVAGKLIIDAGEDKTICVGESVILTAEGNGDFLWSTGETTQNITVSPNKPSSYWVSNSNGDCSVSDELFVDVQKAAAVSLGEDMTICVGELVTLRATGHGDYLWSNGATSSSISVRPTVTTTYSIVASSSACNADATDEITIFVNEAVKADAGKDVSVEPGESITLTATGGNSFLWSTGETTASISVNPENTKTYTVEVGNGTNCDGIDDIKVTVLEDIPLMINNGQDITICKGDELILQARGSDNYLWNTRVIEAMITVSPEVTTTYSVSAQKNGILETQEIVVTVEDCANKKVVDFNVYPNPSEGVVNITIPTEKEGVKLIVSTLNGKIILQRKVKGDRNGVFTQINLSHVANGIYFIKMYNDNFSATRKVIII